MNFPAVLRIRLLTLALIASAGVGYAQDSKPVLLSRTGGNAWSNPKELEAAAKNNNPKALAQLGEMLLRGNADFSPDVPRALLMLEQAARAGQATAAFRMGMLLENGDNVAKDEARALAYFRAAAAGGSGEAFRNAGVAYSTARGVKRDYAEALAWLILAKKHGTAGTVEDDLRAYVRRLGHPEWIMAGEKRAPELERELAQGSVVKFLPPPAPFDSPSRSTATLGPVSSAEKPAAPSLDKVEKPAPGKFTFETGALPALSPPKVPDVPAPRSAADDLADNAPVKLVLATGRPASWPNLATLQAEADQNKADALAAFGQLYLTGQQVSTNPSLALSLLERGAKAGSADAAGQLAEVYTKGLQAPRDETKAFTYTLQAASGGVRTAIYNLGALYANGSGTKADYTEALAWLMVAQHFNLDSGQASRIRDYLAKSDAKQIPLAERRAADRVKQIEAARANLGL
jgi:TPR repeat protein